MVRVGAVARVDDFRCITGNCTCASSPCIDPALPAAKADVYWTQATLLPAFPAQVWSVDFATGDLAALSKTATAYGRAVQGGF